MIYIETIYYDIYHDWFVATLENGEEWVVLRTDIPSETDIYDFIEEVINNARI